MNQPKDNEVKDSLRADGQVVDQEIDAPEPTRRQTGTSDGRGRRYAIVATAVATIVVGGVIALSIFDRADVTTAGSADTTAHKRWRDLPPDTSR